jgi:hypothetical protein
LGGQWLIWVGGQPVKLGVHRCRSNHRRRERISVGGRGFRGTFDGLGGRCGASSAGFCDADLVWFEVGGRRRLAPQLARTIIDFGIAQAVISAVANRG